MFTSCCGEMVQFGHVAPRFFAMHVFSAFCWFSQSWAITRVARFAGSCNHVLILSHPVGLKLTLVVFGLLEMLCRVKLMSLNSIVFVIWQGLWSVRAMESIRKLGPIYSILLVKTFACQFWLIRRKETEHPICSTFLSAGGVTSHCVYFRVQGQVTMNFRRSYFCRKMNKRANIATARQLRWSL